MLFYLRILQANIVVFIILLCVCSSASSAPAWEHIHQAEGIKVYKRDSTLGDLPDFKAIGRVKASIYDVMAVLQNVGRRAEWVYRCETSKVVKRYGDFEVLLYHKTYSPWPASDRDAAVKTQLYEIEAEKKYLAYFKGVHSTLIPKKDGLVRLPQIEGYYLLKSIRDQETQITYFVHLDPGGYLPRWLIKMTTKDFPTETLIGLRKQIKKTKKSGIYKSFHQRWNPHIRPQGTPAPYPHARLTQKLIKRLGI